MKLKERYDLNKTIAVNQEICCPSCGTKFIKKTYNQSFCKTQKGTKCKDKYWNTIDPNKRNNTTRISPASLSFQANRLSDKMMYDKERNRRINHLNEFIYDPHPFSCEGLGQWDDC